MVLLDFPCILCKLKGFIRTLSFRSEKNRVSTKFESVSHYIYIYFFFSLFFHEVGWLVVLQGETSIELLSTRRSVINIEMLILGPGELEQNLLGLMQCLVGLLIQRLGDLILCSWTHLLAWIDLPCFVRFCVQCRIKQWYWSYNGKYCQRNEGMWSIQTSAPHLSVTMLCGCSSVLN